jgi:hypothetical protein
MTGKRTSDQPAPTLPAHRAFVVHFQTTGDWRRRFAGRVEHLSSGRFVHFGSLRGLLHFFAQFLDAAEEPRP